MGAEPTNSPEVHGSDEELEAIRDDPDRAIDERFAAGLELDRRRDREAADAALTPPDDASPDALLTAALARAQGRFPAIARNHTAEVRGKDGKPGYSYSYADLGDVLAAVRPVLAAEGIAVVQRTGVPGQNGKTLLRTELRHVGGGILDSETEVGAPPANPQQFGGSLTYLRRYELVTLLGIAAEQDLDAQEVEPPGRERRTPDLPGWARPAAAPRKSELVDVLTPLMGRDAARAVGSTIKAEWGEVPDGAVAIAKLIISTAATTLGDDWINLVRMIATALEERAKATETAARQDAGAEAPDPPSPAEAEVDAPAAEAEAEVLTPEAEAELERTAAEAALEAPLPGTVSLPDPLPADRAKKVGALKAAGCTCPDPLQPTDDSCPLQGHGIPF